MPRKKTRRYDQTVSAPYFQPTQGSQVAGSLQRLIARLFGSGPAPAPNRREIVDYHLTPREREVAYLAALGFSDQQIADALAMNFQTVRVHLRNVLNKMQLHDVSELREYISPHDRY